MSGWNLKKGLITNYEIDDDHIWSLFNFVFSDSSKKRNTYKFGLIKSLLNNLFNGKIREYGVYVSYEDLFGKFAENFWNLVVKYNLRQMRKDGKSEFSKIESILKSESLNNQVLGNIDFSVIDNGTKSNIISKVSIECKKYVVGALYDDFDGTIYSFDLNESGIILNPKYYDFMLKYKSELERLNYYSWAKFLEHINKDNDLIRVIDKLELATPKRQDLSLYREILWKEFEENTCFYCGRKLHTSIHVDHFIPWSFVKDDKIWNFVLACPQCNERKNNRVASKDYVARIITRNKLIKESNNNIIRIEFNGYSDDIIDRMWTYAKLSGLKECDLG